ncbi:MAG: YggS family pyridoxal phosphate-dependent enzyme [Polaromonas sp.]|nr:YggS family pyridoxal phosphate-dependent enzyme [Polaromonas sp.]
MTTIALNLHHVRDQMLTACIAAGRHPDSVQLLAVSKTFGPDCVREAVATGQRAFGENYITEGAEKIQALGELRAQLVWHCIGPVQSNKTRLVAEHFDWVQSVDRLKIAQRLSEQRPAGLPPLQVCLQVNMDGGANKSGVTPDALQALAEAVLLLPNLALRGLMMIPEPAIHFEAACAINMRAKAIFDTLNQVLAAAGRLTVPMDTLSLGMSGDLEAAIHSGSTMVRVGSAIFGRRG